MSKFKELINKLGLGFEELSPSQLRAISKYGMDISDSKVIEDLIRDYRSMISTAARNRQTSLLISINETNREFVHIIVKHFEDKKFNIRVVSDLIIKERDYIFIEW